VLFVAFGAIAFYVNYVFFPALVFPYVKVIAFVVDHIMAVVVDYFGLARVVRAFFAGNDKKNLLDIYGAKCARRDFRATLRSERTGQLNQDEFMKVASSMVRVMYIPQKCTGQGYEVVKKDCYHNATGEVEPLASWKSQFVLLHSRYC
jgi:hypothetical protein